MKFGFIVYPQMQLMDLVGPLEVLNTWQTLDRSLEIIYIAETMASIDAGSGFTLKVDYIFDDAPQLDYVCVPGGKGRLMQMHNPRTLKFIQSQYAGCKLITAVCTGAFILYNAGILANQKVTTYWRALPELVNAKDIQISQERKVKSGKIWTSGGVSSGVDLMFEVIHEIAGAHVAGMVQLLFEYFPNNKSYCLADDVHDLPLYATEKSILNRSLPRYICEYIETAQQVK